MRLQGFGAPLGSSARACLLSAQIVSAMVFMNESGSLCERLLITLAYLFSFAAGLYSGR